MESATRREVTKMIQAMTGPSSALGARVEQLAGTYVNRLNGSALVGAATIPIATTATDTLIVWMAVMPILASGLFDVRISAAVTGGTSPDSINWQLATDWPTLGTYPVLTGGNAFGSRSTYYSGGAAASHVALMQTNSAAGGITYTHGTTGQPGVSMYATGAQIFGTAGTTMQFNYAGTVGLSIAAATGIVTPFTAAANVYAMIMLSTTISAASATFQSFSADVSERPW
jgi:hypothetical protein